LQEDAASPGLTQLAGDFMSPADASIGQSFDAFTGILKNGYVKLAPGVFVNAHPWR